MVGLNLRKRAFMLARGSIAGAVATVAMKGVFSLLESKKSGRTRVQEAFADQKSAERAFVDRVNKQFHLGLSRNQRKTYSTGVRWGLGVGSGIISSYLWRRLGAQTSPWKAAAVSALTFVLVDEVLKPMIGARPSPMKVPMQTHAAALAGHATYGLVNAGVGQTIAKFTPSSLQG